MSLHSEQTARSSRILPHIPIEVATQISQHLDLESARSLALTCKSLRDCGECRIWEELDVASDWSDIDSTEIPDVRTRLRQTQIVESKLQHVMSGLEAYPLRLQRVLRLRMEPSDGKAEDGHPRAKALVKLLHLVGPGLTQLTVVPRMGGPERKPDPLERYGVPRLPHPLDELDHRLFFGILSEGKLPLPRVTHLKYACGAYTAMPLGRWLLQMTSLVDLEFCSADGAFSGQPSFQLRHDELPHLKRISFDHLYDGPSDHSITILGQLVYIAPNLETLRLRGRWVNPNFRDMALTTVHWLKKLRTLMVCHTGDKFWEAADPKTRIGYSKMGTEGKELGVEQLIVEKNQWTEFANFEVGPTLAQLIIQYLRLPHSKTIKQLTVLTAPRPPLSDYIAGGIGPPADETAFLDLEAIDQLHNCPNLTSVLLLHVERPFPTVYTDGLDEPEYSVDPSRWEAEGYSGSIIRQYVQYAPDGTYLDEFWDIRTLGRPWTYVEGSAQRAKHRIWDHTLNYGSHIQPEFECLEAIYEAAGISMDFTEGGRGLPLGEGAASEAAWQILRDWRDYLPDVDWDEI